MTRRVGHDETEGIASARRFPCQQATSTSLPGSREIVAVDHASPRRGGCIHAVRIGAF
jgi:hypothetical protein